MVYIVEVDGLKYYACGICGLLYESEELAKSCEDFCRTHPGMCNIELAKSSVGYLDLSKQVQKVYFKVEPTRKCVRPYFRLCKASVRIYSY